MVLDSMQKSYNSNKIKILRKEENMEKEKMKWPFSDEKEIEQVKEVLASDSWWRGTGKKVLEFEKKFAKYHNIKYCLAVSNGTHAIEIALKILGVGKGDEVIVPAFTFVSTATAVLMCGATPIFCDVSAETFCLDPESFRKVISEKTKAVIPVHMAGNVCDMEKINQIAKENNVKIVEDAAHAQGGEWRGNKVGFYSDMATFSFQNRKVMTCGEGGALITNSKELYDKAYLVHSVGRPPGDIVYDHLVLGSNDRMGEFQAAILLCQLERLENFTKIREENAKKLNEYLSEIPGITPQKFSDKCTVNTHYMYMFYYDKTMFDNMDKDTFIQKLNEEGIECHVPYPLIFNTKFFKNDIMQKHKEIYDNLDPQLYPNALKISQEVVWIPHYELVCDNENLYKIKETISDIQKHARKE